MGDGGDGNGATYLRRRRQGDPGGFAEQEGNGAFLERSGAEMKTAIFQRGDWTKGRRRGSFSGRGNDQTNIIHRQT